MISLRIFCLVIHKFSDGGIMNYFSLKPFRLFGTSSYFQGNFHGGERGKEILFGKKGNKSGREPT